MTLNVATLLNPKTPTEADDNRKRAEAELLTVEDLVAEREREREAALLDGSSDAEIAKIVKDRDALKLQADRLRAAITKLSDLREELAQAEAERDATGKVAEGRKAQKAGIKLTAEVGELLEQVKAKMAQMPSIYATIETGIAAATEAGIEHDLKLPHIALSVSAIADEFEEQEVREELPGIFKQAAGGEMVRERQPGEATHRTVRRPVLVKEGTTKVSAPDLRSCSIELPNVKDSSTPILKRGR